MIRILKRYFEERERRFQEEREWRRYAHFRILLSSVGGTRLSGKDGKLQVGHIKANDR